MALPFALVWHSLGSQPSERTSCIPLPRPAPEGGDSSGRSPRATEQRPGAGSGCRYPLWPNPAKPTSRGLGVAAGGGRPGALIPLVGAMPGARKGSVTHVEPKALAGRAKAEGARETPKPRKKPPYLFPLSVMRLGNIEIRERERPPAPETLSEPEQSQEEGSCGLGCVSFPCCQRLNDIRCFMVIYFILASSQGIVFGLVDLSISNFQKNYHLKTFESIVLTSSYDISSCLVAILIAYYGGRGNRTKWTAYSSFFIGLGSILLGLPHLRGENNQSKLNIEGFAEAAIIFGYACGHAMGAPLVKVAENSTSSRNNMGRGGNLKLWWNWWNSFLLASLIAWSTLIPLLCFPRNIAGTAKITAGKCKKTYSSDNLKDKEFGTSIKDLFAALWILMKNPVFILLCLSKASESLVLIGASEFLPRYLENQFILTPTVATIISGLILLPGGALGQLLGGVIVSKLEMSCKALMRFVMVTSAVSVVTLVVLIFIHCDSVKFAGINEDYDGTGQMVNLTAPCNKHCRCSTALYSSVCGRDNVEYFSPCFAGCRFSKYSQEKKQTYYNCSCIHKGLTGPDQDGDIVDARLGKCDANCHKLPLFIALLLSSIIFSGFSGIPGTLCIFRVVPDKLCSLALGMSYTVLRIFGSIPGPLIFKMTVETSCTFRDSEQCTRIGRCWMYDKTKMAYQFIGICVFCKLCTIFFTAVAFYVYKGIRKESTESLPMPMRILRVKGGERTDL
nr:solute carrier organic anion transporter family member 6A1 isoform X2 [Oryctolagus cuniculus]